MFKIYLVIDVIGWVQHKRAKEFILQNKNRKFNYVIITYSNFINNIERCNKENCLFYIFSWRNLDDDINLIPKKIRSKIVIGVTSHYNVGGIKNLSKCMTKNMPIDKRLNKTLKLLRSFKYVSVNSRILQKYLNDKLKYKTFLLENGVDHNYFKISKKNKNKKIVIGWNGKNKNAKNYELLNELKKFHSKNTKLEFKFLVANRKLSFLNKIKNKFTTGNIVKNFYKKIDYYICVSWHEGTPNPCLEALSCGIPVITTKVGNMPDVIEDNKNGFLIEPEINSVNSIILKIQNIQNKHYEKMSKYCRQKIVNEWSWHKKYKNIEDMLMNIIKIEFNHEENFKI